MKKIDALLGVFCVLQSCSKDDNDTDKVDYYTPENPIELSSLVSTEEHPCGDVPQNDEGTLSYRYDFDEDGSDEFLFEFMHKRVETSENPCDDFQYRIKISGDVSWFVNTSEEIGGNVVLYNKGDEIYWNNEGKGWSSSAMLAEYGATIDADHYLDFEGETYIAFQRNTLEEVRFGWMQLEKVNHEVRI